MNSVLAKPTGWIVRLFRREIATIPKVAVLIDGDGVSPKSAEHVLQNLSALGHVSIQRVYGNFSAGTTTAWSEVIGTHGIVARHMPTLVPGKNASDVALTIDAIELLLSRKIDTFVLIASDTDFAPLAYRIRADGKSVIGFGQKSTPMPFRHACTKFQEMQPPSHANSPTTSRKTPADAEALLLPELRRLSANGQPVVLSVFGQHIVETIPHFKPRAYGRRRLSQLLRALPSVEVIELDGIRYVRPSSDHTGTD